MIEWNVDPTLVTIPLGPGGAIHIRYYGLMFAIGFLTGYQLIYRFCKIEGWDFLKLEPLLYYVVIGMTLGARLGHVLFYEPGYYFSNPAEIPKIWQGGLASHGGALGVIIGIWLFSRKNPQFSMLWIMDRLSIPTALTFGLIRLGNLMNSEILGRPTEVPWAFIFQRIDNIPRHPVQLYESLGYLTTFVILLFLYQRMRGLIPAGRVVSIMIILSVSVRFIAEFFKMPQADFEADLLLSMGQLLSFPFLAFGIGLLIYSFKQKVPTPPKAHPKKKKK